MKKITIVFLVSLNLLVGALASPTGVAAKCPDVPDDLVCAELHYSFLPARPIAGQEVTVIAYWVEQHTTEPITNVQWLARKGKPAYLWLWDHEPTELESIAYVQGIEGRAELPQLVIPLQWNAEKREYRGSFVTSGSGRWYFMLRTVVPDALRTAMDADSDYGGLIQTMYITQGSTRPLSGITNWPAWLALVLGSGLAISVLFWLSPLVTS